MNIKELTIEDIKNALWAYSNNRLPGKGIFASRRELRQELYIRTGETLGYHEEPYENKDRKCDCDRCELVVTCPYRDRYQRHPKDLAPGALGLCKKL